MFDVNYAGYLSNDLNHFQPYLQLVLWLRVLQTANCVVAIDVTLMSIVCVPIVNVTIPSFNLQQLLLMLGTVEVSIWY